MVQVTPAASFMLLLPFMTSLYPHGQAIATHVPVLYAALSSVGATTYARPRRGPHPKSKDEGLFFSNQRLRAIPAASRTGLPPSSARPR